MKSKKIRAFAVKSGMARGKAAAGLRPVNTIGALAGLVARNYRLWADVTFGAGAGLYALGLTTVLGAIMIALNAIVLRPKPTPNRQNRMRQA